MNVKLAIGTFALLTMILPSITAAQDQDTDNATHTVTGCLRQGATPTSFMFSDENGKLWEVHSKTVRLAPHVGHTVELTGTIPKQPKNSTDTSPQDHLVVTSLKMVRDTCKQ
ncbi:MAG: hypothetical protein ABSE45_04160 [Candidatus Acidiferrales bacterium]|jgi:hypothetical protein